MKYSVVVIGEHTLISQALEEIINTFKAFYVLYTCKSEAELMGSFLRSSKNIPDIVLMDTSLSVMSEIETVKWIADNYPKLHVVALSAREDHKMILKVLQAGATGYLLKDTSKKEFEKALIRLVNHGFYHAEKITRILANSMEEKTPSKESMFKNNELVFMRLACSELTYKEIAEKMYLSPKTIDGYRDNLFTKLEVRNRVGLVMYAIKNNIFIP